MAIIRMVTTVPELTVHACWEKAQKEFPDDQDRRGRRYVELLREQGHIVEREPGDDSPLLPCGWGSRNPRKNRVTNG